MSRRAALALLGMSGAGLAAHALMSGSPVQASVSESVYGEEACEALEQEVARLQGITVNALDYGVDPTGQQDSSGGIQAAIQAANGRTLVIPAGTYLLIHTVTIEYPVTIMAHGALFLHSENKTAILVKAGGVHWNGGQFTGAGKNSLQNSNCAFNILPVISGPFPGTYLSDISIRDVVVAECGGFGISVRWAENFRVEGCTVKHCALTGIRFLGCRSGLVLNNRVSDIVDARGAGFCYGIQIAHTANRPEAQEPRSMDILVMGNWVEDVPWNGMNSHGGIGIQFIGNRVLRCYSGISAVSTSPSQYQAPRNTVISGNYVDGGPLPASASPRSTGIKLIGPNLGVTDRERASGVISGNYIYNYGDFVYGNTGAGIQIGWCEGVSVGSNYIDSCYGTGIRVDPDTRSAAVTGNVFVSIMAINSSQHPTLLRFAKSQTGFPHGSEVMFRDNAVVMDPDAGDTVNKYGVFFTTVTDATQVVRGTILPQNVQQISNMPAWVMDTIASAATTPLGFFGAAGQARQTVTGGDTDQKMASLLDALRSYGLID